MHPVERSLYVRQASSSYASNPVGIGSHSETHAIHDSGEAHVRSRQDVNLRAHPRRNVLKLSFTEVAYRPPGGHVDQCEDLLTDMRVAAFRDDEICDTSIERRIHPAVIE